jgi:Carboxypeptidase regulatory-like domain
MRFKKRVQQLLSILRWSLLVTALAALALPAAHAQSTGGQIRGTVTDASGGTIAGVTVQLINQATQHKREAPTSTTGDYVFLEVPVGTYEIDVEQQGFKKYVHKGIVLNLNQVLSVDITLQVGGTTQVVEVTGEPPVVDTTTTQLGAVVDSRSTTELPLNQRDAYQLLQLQPGVQSQLGNSLFYGSDKAGVVTVNGGRGRANNYSVNGGDGNDLFVNLPAIQPSPDSIEEFRVITNAFDAEYGRNSGSVVNVVTKSGTNQWHGSTYEFFRNAVLNAHPFTFSEAPKPAFKQNQFGGTFGGPIKKDKTFFFGSYEGRRIVQGILSTPVSVPDSGEVIGDFSGVGAANGLTQFAGVVNDQTVASILQQRCGSAINAVTPTGASELSALASGGGSPVPYSDIFPNMQIPTSCFDPVAVNLMQRFVPGAGGTGQVQVTPNSTDSGNQFQIRVDQNFTANQKLSAYYYFDDGTTMNPFATFQAAGANLGNFPGVYATRSQQLNISHTSTIGATAVNEARFTWFREGQLKFDAPQVTNAITDSCAGNATPYCFTGTPDVNLIDGSGNALGTSPDYGIHSGLGAKFEGVPFISVGGGFAIGNNSEGQLPQIGNTFQWSDNYSKIVGAHSFKFGADVRYQKFDQTLYYDINGLYGFQSSASFCDLTADPTCTQASLYSTGNDVGFADGYANYLLGLPTSYSQGSAQKELVRSTSVYLFAQDSWKIKPNVTLNYGLRWELNTPLTDIGHRVQTYRVGQNSAIYPCTITPNDPLYATFGTDCNAAGVTPTGLVFPGDKGVPNGMTATYYRAFAPRLGLNWSPGWNSGFGKKLTGGPSKTSIGLGWGLFYNPIEQLVLEQFSAEPPFGGSNYISNPLFNTPYVDQSGNVYPNPFNGILDPPRGQPQDWASFRSILLYGQFQPNMRAQYSAQYNLTIKRELPGNILFQIGYVGSQGHRLLGSYDLNPGNPNTCNDLAAMASSDPASVLSYAGGPQASCGPYSEDNSYFIPAGTVIPSTPNGGLILPYTGTPGGNPKLLPSGTVVGANGITLVGIRPYSSPNCNPMSGAGCPADGLSVFSNIFTENTIAKSNYNSLQAMLEKRFSHGLQFQAAYTYSKSMDNGSSFESSLNPYNLNATYGPSLYDARHRFVFNYVWAIPVPKMSGFKGALLNGWQASGIITYQSGFPIRITSSDDVEQYGSYFFEPPGEPNWAYSPGQLHKLNIRQSGGFVFDPNQFTNSTVAPGTVGNAPRSLCCGPGINNWDVAFLKDFSITERAKLEFRAELFNVWNHAQFYNVDGNVSDQGSTFGQVQNVRDPRLVQFALKLSF